MAAYVHYRNLHLWVGLILLIPVSIIALTGVLWNHEKTLGIKREYKKPKHGPVSPAAPVELTAASDSWRQHGAAVDAALAAGRAEWGENASLERIELRNEPGYGLLVKVKAPKEANVTPEEIVWSVAEGRVVERKGDREAGMDWAKVVHDLHTGKIFSDGFGFLWSDSGALAILFLGVTGVVLYLIPVFKKRAQRRRNAARPEAVVVKAPAAEDGVLAKV